MFINLLKSLPFSEINEELLNYLVESEFSDTKISCDLNLDKNLLLTKISTINNSFREHFKIESLSSITWRHLIEDHGIDVNKCLSLVLCILNHAKIKKYVQLAFESSSLYFILITIPLNRITNIFHQNLYLQCLETEGFCSAEQCSDYSFNKTRTSIINYFLDLKTALECFDHKDQYSLDNTMRLLITTVLKLNATTHEISTYIYDCVLCLFNYCKHEEVFLSIIKYATPFLSMCEQQHLNANEQNENLKKLVQFLVKLMEKFGDEISEPFLQLTKSMTILSAEKPGLIDIRRKRITVIIQFAKALSPNYFEEYMKWFTSFTNSTKKQHRVFAQQFILQLLPKENSDLNFSQNSYTYEANKVKTMSQSHKKVFLIILDRCYDTNDEVATKALQNLAEAFKIPHMNDLLTHIFSSDDTPSTSIDTRDLPKADSINKLLLYYLNQDKISLRKAALQTLECLAVHKPRQWLQLTLKRQLVVMVRDFAISVRSNALNILTEYVSKYMIEDQELIYVWVENVLPEASNTLSGLDNKIYSDFATLFLGNLVSFDDLQIKTNSEIPWIILQYIHKKRWRQYLEDSIKHWNSKKIINSNVITIMQTYINTKYNLYALLFLSCMSKTIKFKDVSFAIEYYQQYITKTKQEQGLKRQLTAMRYVLEILSSKHATPADKKYALSDSLILQITTWNVPVKLAVNFMDTITNLQNSADWKEHYIEIACDTIKEGLSALQDEVPFNTTKFEIALLLYAENITGIRKLPFRQLAIRLCHKICSVEQSVTLLFRQKPTLFRTMLLTLGRLCLREEIAATHAIPIYIKIMLRSSQTNEKILCLIVLKDLCTMYTRLVEPHIDVLLLCLRYENNVRALTARILTELITDGYIKFNQEQMVCYLSMVLDEQKDVKCVVDYYISQKATISQDKDFLHDILLNVIYFHNNKVSSLPLGKAFSYHSDEMTITRRNLYRYIVFNMREISKFKTVCTLYTNILERWSMAKDECSNGAEELAIVCDALAILSLTQMKPEYLIVGGKKSDAEEDDARMETDEEEAHVDDKKLITLIEMMASTLLKFKTKLQDGLDSSRAEILKQMFNNYVDELSKDYKKQIKKLNPEISKPLFCK